MKKTVTPFADIHRILTESGVHTYYTGSKRRYHERLRRRGIPTNVQPVYYGWKALFYYVQGVHCIYIWYVARRAFDNTHNNAACDQTVHEKYRREKLGSTRHCTLFMGYARKQMARYGYMEYPGFKGNGSELLYVMLSKRFYHDLYLYRNGFKELEVLDRVDNFSKRNKGLSGKWLVYRKFFNGTEYRYGLRSMDTGYMQQDRHAMTLRELILHGYYPIGRSSHEHIMHLTTYWSDAYRKLYLPPETSYTPYDRCTWAVWCARKRIQKRLMQQKINKKHQ